MSVVELNSKGTNAAIKANILDDETMREIGFTDRNEAKWCFNREILGIEISFDMTIPKDGSDIEIVTIDEDFLQPYDYQRILESNPNFKVANMVKEHVEEWMQYLTDKGVIEGWHKGMYI